MKKVFNFNTNNITKDKVKEILSDNQIYEFYLGDNIEFTRKFNSPFRKDDHPSLSFFLINNHTILWRDWGSSLQDKPQDVFSFVMTYYNCSFREALEYINIDFNLNFTSDIQVSTVIFDREIPTKRAFKKVKEKKIIEVETQNFTIEDVKFWKSFEISLETLIKYNVRSIKYCWLNYKLFRTYTRSNPIYSFELINEEGEIVYKIYSPYEEKNNKWFSNVSKDTVQGLSQLKYESDTLIITKSLKDVMVLDTFGYESIAFQSEISEFSNFIYENVVSLYKNIIVFYDNDQHGITNSNNMCEKYSFKQISIPQEFKAKDISDYVKKYGVDNTKIFIKTLINNAKIYNSV